MSKDYIGPGTTDHSEEFHLSADGITITEFKAGYIRWNEGDGSSFAVAINALTALAAITDAHADNKAIYLSSDSTSGNKRIIRVDFPDAAFASGKNRLILNIYSDNDEVIAQKEFILGVDYAVYPGGFVYVNTASGNTDSRVNVDGTPEKPVSNHAASVALAAIVNKKLAILGNLTTEDLTGYEIMGRNAAAIITGPTPNGSAPNWSDAWIHDIKVTGFGRMNNSTRFVDCLIYSITGQAGDGFQGYAERCKFHGTIALEDDGGNSVLKDCGSEDNNTAPTFDYQQSGNDHDLVIENFSGSLTIDNMDDGTLTIYSDGKTKVTLTANCTGGTVVMVGVGNLVNNGSVVPDLTQWQELPLNAANLGTLNVNVIEWLANAVAASTAGIPNVNVSRWLNNVVTGDGDWAQLVADIAVIDQNVDDIEALLIVVDGKIDVIDQNVDDIEAIVNNFTFTSAGKVDANMLEIDSDADSAVRQKKAMKAINTGTVGTGTHTATSIASSDLTSLADGNTKFNTLNFTSGPNNGRSIPITSFTNSTGAMTFDSTYALDYVPTNGDTFTVT